MSTSAPLTALVVHESMFDNTKLIAAAVARGLSEEGMDVSSADVAAAPDLITVDVDLWSLRRPQGPAGRRGDRPRRRVGSGPRRSYQEMLADATRVGS